MINQREHIEDITNDLSILGDKYYWMSMILSHNQDQYTGKQYTNSRLYLLEFQLGSGSGKYIMAWGTADNKLARDLAPPGPTVAPLLGVSEG